MDAESSVRLVRLEVSLVDADSSALLDRMGASLADAGSARAWLWDSSLQGLWPSFATKMKLL